VLIGGDPVAEQPGYFYPTTLVADIDNDNPLVAEEQFGPVLPIIKYTDLEQAIEWANGLEVGLGSSVWGTDLDACREVAAACRPVRHGSTNTVPWIRGYPSAA
jgi:acyl-CoA reductase-like NAD-dependent aldehyde dehydrogenase